MNKPENVTWWMWLHPEFSDRELWQQCLCRCAHMPDTVGWAVKLYVKLGGQRKVYVPVRQRRKKQ